MHARTQTTRDGASGGSTLRKEDTDVAGCNIRVMAGGIGSGEAATPENGETRGETRRQTHEKARKKAYEKARQASSGVWFCVTVDILR